VKFATHPIAPVALVGSSLCLAGAAHAQDDAAPSDASTSAAPSADAAGNLAKQLSNPIASLISVPFQQNFDFGAGPTGDGFKSTLNIQPVVPISIAPEWNMVVRTIVPIVYQEDISAAGASEFGLGDTVQSVFFSPKEIGASGIVWGAGPVFLYPTATDRFLGGEKWGAGPTVVLLKQAGKNTIGFLGNHIFSVAGDDTRGDISATFMQPFFSHTTARATTYSINTETTYDWLRESWTVPVNVGVAQLMRMGAQPVQIGITGRYYLEKPAGGPDWGVRLNVTLLFPKK
jgi:hypothetical protein